jgi:translocation and assembly module TamA
MLRVVRLFCGLLLAVLATPVSADLSYDIRGIDDPLKSNILGYINTVQLGGRVRLSERDFDQVVAKAITNARRAIRPYGYYSPEINGRIARDSVGGHVLELVVNPGPPVRVAGLQIEVKGEGDSTSEVTGWRDQWPLQKGDVLDQTLWEQHKQVVIDSIRAIGFLGAKFEVHKIELDLDRNTADLALVLNTGPRYRMGNVDFAEHVLRPGLLEYVQRFSKGDAYTARRMSDFRADLWKTGYFTDVEVEEIVRADVEPPTVDLRVVTKTETRDSYQGALGLGSDTGLRLQATWNRHPISANGDRIDVGIGWQELNDEYGIRTTYRKPRFERAREFWIADLTIKFEKQDLEFKLDDEDENFITIANGDISEQNLRLGRLKIINFESGDKQLFATPFIQYLHSNRDFTAIRETQPFAISADDPPIDELLNPVEDAISIGFDADLVSIRGKGFDTRGHRERAWVFAANESFGSDATFTQLYVSTRRSYVAGDRWKFLLRAEVGYTDADINGFILDTDEGTLDLSITQLPNFYRFKAGGSQSVRGYSFEQLSNNNVGSNHKITASAEVEMKFLPNWSAAAFVDIGNAFNDWSNPELKTGIGVGIRWYSIAGPIRIDVAQAVDFTGKPWHLHFTIGTPLL